MAKFSISILALNNIELTKKCIFSVLQNSRDFELILTDNGSTDGTHDYFRHLSAIIADVKIVRNEENKGFIAPNRHALTLATGERFVMLNNDTIVHGDWLNQLDAPFVRSDKAALCCPEGGCCELLPTFHGRPGRFDYCEGAMLMCRTELVRKHGLFSDYLEGAYGEDSDLSLRMKELGYTIHRVPVKYEHLRGSTASKVPQAKAWQERNHAVLRQRWAKYLSGSRMDSPTIVKRPAAHGDVLLTTPIIRELKRIRPCSPIWFETNCPEVLRNNPHIAKTDRRFQNVPPGALVINLHMAYEDMLNTAIVDAYAMKADVIGCDRRTEIFLTANDEAFGHRAIPQGTDWIAIHVGPTSWASKNWVHERWEALVAKLPCKVVVVGHDRNRRVAGAALNLCGQATHLQTAAVIKRCKLFIGVDSLPIHLAQAVGTPVVGLFGVTTPELILTDGSPWAAARAVGENVGIRHKVTGQCTIMDPQRCMDSITVEQVMEQVESFL